MRKIVRKMTTIIITLIICSLFMSSRISIVNGSWGVTAGEKLEYELVQSSWDITYGNFKASGTGGTFDNVLVQEGEAFNISVLSTDPNWGIEFEFTNSTDTASRVITQDSFLFDFLAFIYYFMWEAERIYEQNVGEEDIINGPKINSLFFAEPTIEFWQAIEEMTTLDFHKALPYEQGFRATLESFFEQTNGLTIFDLYMRGDFQDTAVDASISFHHNIKFVWNETTGVLQGYRANCIFSGQYQGIAISEEMEVVLKLASYSLPNYKFIMMTGFIPGYTFGITFLLLASISAIVIITTKRKRKKGPSH